jgi:hypothetical protein
VTEPADAGPGEPAPIRGGLLALGVVLGLVGTVIWMTVVFVVAIGQENSQTSSINGVAVFVAWLLPLPLSILLLCFRRTRQAAAGFVMGLAIGTLVLAGLCTSILLPGLTG